MQVTQKYERLWIFGWAIFILGFLGYNKIGLSLVKKTLWIDGGFYTSVAVHVRDGLGLATNISLYHQAFSYFPHESSISPIWPLIYGYTSRFFDIYAVAIWLPTLFYFVAIIGGYFWATRLFPDSFFPKNLPGFNAGHLFMIMLGLHKEFFQFTSVPYTEAIAFALLGIGLWRLHRILKKPNLLYGLEAGIWISVLFLSRNQLSLVAIAVYITLFWSILSAPKEKNRWLTLLGTIISSTLIVGSYYFFFLKNFVDQPALVSLLRFDLGKESASLSEFDTFIRTKGPWDYIKDRATGFPVAFNVKGPFAYARSFYAFQYALLAAIPLVATLAIKYRKQWRTGFAWLKTPDSLPWIMVVLFSIGALFSMHLIHFNYFVEWHFARRHATVVVYLFFFSFVLLLKHHKFWMPVGVFLLGASIFWGGNTVFNIPDNHKNEKLTTHQPALHNWLTSQGKISVVMTEPHPLYMAFRTPNVGYHWVYHRTTYKDIKTLTSKLNVDFVVVYPNAMKWTFMRDTQFKENYSLVKTIQGVRIYKEKEVSESTTKALPSLQQNPVLNKLELNKLEIAPKNIKKKESQHAKPK